MNKSDEDAEVRRLRIVTVREDLELALRRAAKAESVADGDTRNHCRAYALKTYLYLRDQLWPFCSPNESERVEIDLKLRKLRDRLERLGGASALLKSQH